MEETHASTISSSSDTPSMQFNPLPIKKEIDSRSQNHGNRSKTVRFLLKSGRRLRSDGGTTNYENITKNSDNITKKQNLGIEDYDNNNDYSSISVYATEEASYGYYDEQLTWVLDLFPKQNVHIIFQEDMREDTLNTIQKVQNFLGVPLHDYSGKRVKRSIMLVKKVRVTFYERMVSIVEYILPFLGWSGTGRTWGTGVGSKRASSTLQMVVLGDRYCLLGILLIYMHVIIFY